MFKRALVTVVLLSAAVAAGIPADSRAAEPLCVVLLPEQLLINRCRDCREVTLQRLPEDQGIPNISSLRLPGDAAVAMSFRGPGRTQIVGERSCPSPSSDSILQISLTQ